MSRKTRSDAKIESTLTPEQLQELIEKFLHERLSYEAARTWLDEQCDLSVSLAALHGFFHRTVAPMRNQLREEQAKTAQAIVNAAKESPVPWEAAALEELNQRTFELLLSGGNSSEALAFVKMFMKARDQEHDSKTLQLKIDQLEESKAAARKELEQASKVSGLDAETLERIERTLGMLS